MDSSVKMFVGIAIESYSFPRIRSYALPLFYSVAAAAAGVEKQNKFWTTSKGKGEGCTQSKQAGRASTCTSAGDGSMRRLRRLTRCCVR